MLFFIFSSPPKGAPIPAREPGPRSRTATVERCTLRRIWPLAGEEKLTHDGFSVTRYEKGASSGRVWASPSGVRELSGPTPGNKKRPGRPRGRPVKGLMNRRLSGGD